MNGILASKRSKSVDKLAHNSKSIKQRMAAIQSKLADNGIYYGKEVKSMILIIVIFLFLYIIKIDFI